METERTPQWNGDHWRGRARSDHVQNLRLIRDEGLGDLEKEPGALVLGLKLLFVPLELGNFGFHVREQGRLAHRREYSLLGRRHSS